MRTPRPAPALLVLLLAAGCATHAPLDSPERALARGRQAVRVSPAVRQLQLDLSAVFNAPITRHATWAVDVRSLDTGESLYRLNADKLVMPASNMKIVTIAAAAEILGWDHRFTTTLETAAPVVNGILEGDLFIRGSGDPTINNRDQRSFEVLERWAEALKQAGITGIRGRIIGDDQAFDDGWLGDGWSWDYLQFGYAAPIGALQFNENVATLTVTPGFAVGAPAHVTLTAGTGYIIVNRTTTSAADVPERISYTRRLDAPVLEVTGSVPVAGTEPVRAVVRNVAVINPTLFFAQSVKDGLIARGIDVFGEAADIDDVAAEFIGTNGSEMRVLATCESPTLREIGTVLMKVSQNQYAETLLKAAGAKVGGLGTATAGRRAFIEVLTAWGLEPGSYVLQDGSGLSRYNYVTASGLTTILERMHTDERHREAFLATLPVAGEDGTLASRMARTRAASNARAKTGSIANVRSLSGYVRTSDGELLAFSIIANDFTTSAATITWMADLGVEILSNFRR